MASLDTNLTTADFTKAAKKAEFVKVSYDVGAVKMPFVIASKSSTLTITLTHGDWPESKEPCVRLSVFGCSTGVFECGGDLVRDKQGKPTGGEAVMTWTLSKEPGLTEGTVIIEVLQPLDTGITVEVS